MCPHASGRVPTPLTQRDPSGVIARTMQEGLWKDLLTSATPRTPHSARLYSVHTANIYCTDIAANNQNEFLNSVDCNLSQIQ